MDWIKIKTKHVLFSDLTESQLGLLIRIQCLTAHLESVPTSAQMLKLADCGPKRLQKLDKVLTSGGQNLDKILSKVLQDVDKVSEKKEQSKQRMAKMRGKEDDVTRNVTLKEKRREEKSIYKENTASPKSQFAPPTASDVRAYCLEKEYTDIDPDIFVNHYEVNGWFRGKTKIKNWKACVATWHKPSQKKGYSRIAEAEANGTL